MKRLDKYKIISFLSLGLSLLSVTLFAFSGYNLGARTENVWRQYSSNAYFGGNVGINTTDPNQKLTLNSGNIATEIQVPSITAATTTITSNLSTTTYYFKLVATDGANGTSTASAEVSKQTTATSTGVQLSWSAVSGVGNYLVFWSTSTGAQTKYFVATSTTGYLFSTTTGAITGSIPTTNTAYVNKISYTGNSWIAANNFGVGTSTPSATLSVWKTGTTTLDFGKFCIKGANSGGTLVYLYLNTDGTWATSSSSCF